MIINRKLLLSASVLSSMFLLSACGQDDAETASAPATASKPAMESAPASESGSDPLAGVEKAEGVVYQDEIYANWPDN